MEHEIHDVLFRWGQAPDDALPSLVQQLHFVPRSAVLTTHQAAAHTDFISQCLREEQDTGAQSHKQTGGEEVLSGRRPLERIKHRHAKKSLGWELENGE